MINPFEKLIKEYKKTRMEYVFIEFTDDELAVIWYSLALARKSMKNKPHKKIVKDLISAIIKEDDRRGS